MKKVRFVERLWMDTIKVAEGNLVSIHSNRSELPTHMEFFRLCSIFDIILYLFICSIISSWRLQYVVSQLVERHFTSRTRCSFKTK